MKINSKLLNKLRISKNWSQEQLSEISGLSLRTIQRLENGGNASIESIRALAEVFEIDPNELILHEEEAPMTVLEAVTDGLLKFADFSGTATRFEYWWFLLFAVLSMAIAAVISERAGQIVTLMLILPLLAVGTRRLNEIGQSAWWQLFFFVPFGQIVVLVFMAQARPKSLDAA